MPKRRSRDEAPVLSVPAPFMERRLLPIAYAAAYCGMSEYSFTIHCTVAPLRLGGRRLWDKKKLDAWIDRLSGGPDEEADLTSVYLSLKHAPSYQERRRAGAKATVLRVISENAPCSLATFMRKRPYYREAGARSYFEELEREKAITSTVVNGERLYRPT